jgi:hypothetical protein
LALAEQDKQELAETEKFKDNSKVKIAIEDRQIIQAAKTIWILLFRYILHSSQQTH